MFVFKLSRRPPMKTRFRLAMSLAALPLIAGSRPASDELHTKVIKTSAAFKKTDPGIQKFFDSAKGYAVFPSVGKGAIGIGGAHGSSELLVGDDALGKT